MSIYLGKPSKLFEAKDPDWVPSVSMGYDRKLADSSRHQRAVKRKLERSLQQEENPPKVHNEQKK